MSDDATLRALEARATPGAWTPDGDKIRATAADALIPDNILVAYYAGHDHWLGLKTTGHAADVEFMAAARTALPDRLDRLDRIRALHAQWASRHPRTRTATSTCGRRSVGSSTASPHERRRGPRGRVIVCPNRQGRPLRCVRCGRPSAFGPVSGRDHQSVSCSPSSSWSRARSSATSCGSSPRQVAQLPRLPTRATRVGQRAVGQPRLYRPLPAILRRARHHDVVRRDPLA